jgi:hypothetical protein
LTLIRAEITVLDTDPNWNGLPANIVMTGISGPLPFFAGDNPAQCPFGEIGPPFWSSAVSLPADFWRFDIVNGVPYQVLQNARPCSSFVAIKNSTDTLGNPIQQIWINATTRANNNNGSTTREYQMRYYSGIPDQPSTKHAELGYSLNNGGYFKSIDLNSVTVKLIFGPAH